MINAHHIFHHLHPLHDIRSFLKPHLIYRVDISSSIGPRQRILEDQLHQLRFARHSKRLSRAALQAAAARAAEEWCVVRPAPFQRQSWVKALCLMEARGTVAWRGMRQNEGLNQSGGWCGNGLVRCQLELLGGDP